MTVKKRDMARTGSRLRLALSAFLILAGLKTVYAVDLLTPYAGEYEASLEFGGQERRYAMHVPKAIKYGGTLPLVIMLHGSGGNAASAMDMTRMNAAAEKYGFLVVYPNGTGRLKTNLLTWNAGKCCGYAAKNNVDDVGFIRALVNWLKTTRKITPGAIFVAGMSNGAVLSHRLGCELADQIAAIAPVAGSSVPADCQPTRPVSVILFNGTADRYVPYEPIKRAVSFWVKRNRCSPSPKTEQWGKIRRDTYVGCDEGTEVVLYTIEGGGHAWPGGTKSTWNRGDIPTKEISASELIVEFFSKHARRVTD